MAQNAYQYGNNARALPRKGAPAVRRRKYQPAVWTKKERRLVAIFAFAVVAIMLGTVYTSVRTDAMVQKSNVLQQKVTETRQDNDSLKVQIQDKTSRQSLDDVAKKENMAQADDNIRNVNR
ncbi:cell division protein FtsL [Lactobacillaceae bacterium L1_55_11]|nr:cell division protein FtsL [Lactobacillaceae bacterium L1_55_11]